MATKRKKPEIEFLETLATAIVNGGSSINGIAFSMTCEGREPYIAFYKDAGHEMVLDMLRELNRVDKARVLLLDEHGIAAPTVSVEHEERPEQPV